MFDVKIIESIDEMTRFEKEWTELEKNAENVHPLLKFDWLLYNWPEQLAPYFCLVFFENKLTCVLPAAIQTKKIGPLRIKIATMGFSDPIGNSGADIIALDSKLPHQDRAITIATEALLSICDAFDFRNIAPDSLLQRAINRSPSNLSDSTVAELQLVTYLPKTHEEFSASLSKSRRKEIRRKKAAADKLGIVELKVIDENSPPNKVESTFKKFLSLKKSRFKAMTIDGTRCMEDLTSTHGPHIAKLVRNKDAVLFELAVDNITMAISYYLRHNTRLIAFQAAFDDGESGVGTGSILDHLTIAYLIEKSSIKEIDWGPGGYAYKKSFSPLERPLINSFGFSSSILGRMLRFSYQLKSKSKSLQYKLSSKAASLEEKDFTKAALV